MTNYERIKAMSLEEMAAFVEAAGRNTCHINYYGDIYYLNHSGKPCAKVIGNIYDDLSY